jgi:hypothetical protein
MHSSAKDISLDTKQLLSMQVAPGTLSAVLTTHLDEDTKAALSLALANDDAPVSPMVCIDEAIGLPGPVSGWIALAIALEAEGPGLSARLVAWHEPGEIETPMCVVTPAQSQEA